MGACKSAAICSSELCCKDRLDTDRMSITKPIVIEGLDIPSSQRQTTIVEDILPKRALQELYLALEVVNSSTLARGLTFVISPEGYSKTHRNPRDGVAYFGCKKRSKLPDGTKGPVVNDVVLPLEDPQSADTNRGRHFMISFDVKTEAYCLQDLGLGFGCYLKLMQPLTLIDEQLIQVGKVFIVLKLVKTQFSLLPRLDIRVYGGAESSMNFSFPPLKERHAITIGRLPESEVSILDDDLISKRQATLFWTTSQWLLTDGDLDQPSTNGTW